MQATILVVGQSGQRVVHQRQDEDGEDRDQRGISRPLTIPSRKNDPGKKWWMLAADDEIAEQPEATAASWRPSDRLTSHGIGKAPRRFSREIRAGALLVGEHGDSTVWPRASAPATGRQAAAR